VWALIAVGLGLGTLLIASVASLADLGSMAVVLGVSLVGAASAVAMGVAISSVSSTHHQATAAAASLWLLLALGMDLLLAGVAPGLRLGPAGLLGAVVLNPLEAARVLAVLLLDGEVGLGAFGTYLIGTFGRGGTIGLLLGTLYVWIVGPLALAAVATSRRDA
jgi:ABC-type transport system involved in multi-copper enzyme maturation permease subunit